MLAHNSTPLGGMCCEKFAGLNDGDVHVMRGMNENHKWHYVYTNPFIQVILYNSRTSC